ncbi:putative C6 transcription factor [Aspergillus homomorphus CBS 101889]|uniref:C6 transcription factor n=1 Tax=Aspergillus homomorphus (strain CBS 101889) TaxID=1450537 RepID=A0A395I0H9_ASPHC|nr:C6 transcription factor [Aspergillus homomorphus CBS 101889]RAL13235.1 C6 transcription factor [Aspergillus homomorphus CBS 101889]
MDGDHHLQSHPSGPTSPAKSPVRRRRPPLSCTICRRRKLKCDRALPCGQCIKSKTPDQCVYVGQQPSKSDARRVDDTPPQRARTSVSRASPAHGGLYVFDSKHQLSANRITKPKARSDELHELRNRVQFLEAALSKAGPIHTPESLGYDAQSEAAVRVAPEAQNLTDDVKALPSRSCFRGKKSRTRYCGRCHSAVTLAFFDDVTAFMRGQRSSLKRNPDYKKFKNFKGEVWARERQDHQRAFRNKSWNLEEMVPPRHVADELVNLYLSTFEMTYRILHVPTFLEEYEAYWTATGPRDRCFVAKLLALMAASSCFLSPTTKIDGGEKLHEAAAEWIAGARSWIAFTLVSSNLDFNILQIECLIVIARQADAIDGDIVWISSGSLIRIAMTMGLHRSPYRFHKMTKYWAEMRRRLWATIVELDLQSSIDKGMPPNLDLEEFDCEAPSNLDDSQLTEDMTEDPVPRDLGTFTRSTFQVLLHQTLPLRVQIAKVVNTLKLTLSYDEALRLSEEINQSMQEGLGTLHRMRTGMPSPIGEDPSFAQSMLVFLMRRSLLVLNRPFALSILRTPKFSYSRKICLESALQMLSYLEPSTEAQALPQLAQLSGGMFRDEFLHAALTVCVELYLQSCEFSLPQSLSMGPSSTLTSFNDLVRSQQEVMLQAVQRTIETFGSRMGPSGKGCKAFFFLTMVLASVKARINGQDPQKVIEQDVMICMRQCEQMMRGASWAAVRDRGEMDNAAMATPGSLSLDAAAPTDAFDPAAFGLDASLDFGNLFDMADFGVSEIWDRDFFASF